MTDSTDPPDSTGRPGGNRRIYEAGIVAAAAIWFIITGRLGLMPLDEGYYQFQAAMFLRGTIPYRDLHMTVPPAGWLIQAGLIKLFGFHLIVGRSYAVIQGIITVIVALALGKRLLKFPFSLIPAALYIPYSVALAGYPHYNLDSAFFLLLSLLLLDTHLRRPRVILIFAAAALGSLAALSKQSHVIPAGALVALTIALGYPQRGTRATITDTAAAFAGSIIPAIMVIAPFAHYHALQEMRECLFGMAEIKRLHLVVILPRAAALTIAGLAAVRGLIAFGRSKRFRRHRLQPGLTLDLWAGAVIAAVAAGHFFPATAYISFLIAVATLSLIVFVHPDPTQAAREWYLIRAFALLSFLVTVISTVDLGHMLLAAVGFVFPAGLLLQNLSRRDRRGRKSPVYYFGLGALAAVWAAGIYLDLAVPHLAFAEGPKWRDNSPVNLPGMELIRLDQKSSHELTQTVTWIKNNTASGEPLFVYPWDSIIYLLADRPPSTYQTVFYYELVTPKLLARTLADLERVRPQVAVVRMEGAGVKRVAHKPDAEAMEGYLKAHYERAERFGDYLIMTRKGGP